ncbi:uracil phosphoribosyltransferase [Nitritalea halalkaliphila LW7]|uniref:Uracil phosphoribosyltransferase n=1 Tax=Nitritalea halalkaliphila LW7 TaxID=1189621 RepID=I5CAF6_9BACT|nr:uracil phosphoribosyltransferase [Nitritalea halalkaliphila]EIM78808.1 uracil phosphoribosyltransferase [Nitritalea halalkaliphila LW7]
MSVHTHILSNENSVLLSYLAELRDPLIQKDRWRFRQNLQRIGMLMAYELSKTLEYTPQTIQTPLGSLESPLLNQQPILINVLRAALPLYEGFLSIFDQADSGFIGAYREPHGATTDPEIGFFYQALPDIDGKEVLFIDPMLASGNSCIQTIEALLRHGKPKHIHIAAVISAPEGIQKIKDKIQFPLTIWTAALDAGLNDQAYILPGLGDAGDLAFGVKTS